ncbi:MAG: TIGR01777 family oxidoreductase [Candidatus Aminicenantes bacterium]|nr:TIGR01777 family oxidoreductase [Candidatus Aminicenantes bacterium]
MSSSRIVITGATGFIGRALCRDLQDAGYEVVVFTRDPARARRLFLDCLTVAGWDGQTANGHGALVSDARAVINLAGENIGAGRWTKRRRRAILKSRLGAGMGVVRAIREAKFPPGVVIQASAVGYYGPRNGDLLAENAPGGRGFLAGVVRQWEDSTKFVEHLGVRRCVIRSGLVLGRDGGVLPRLLRPFCLGLGGTLGLGRQWVSWVHMADEVRAIRFLVENDGLSGVFNLTAPRALQERDLARTIGRRLKRRAWLPVPGLALQLAYGRMAKETLLSGQRIEPRRLLESGFSFAYPDAESALSDLLP